MGSKRRQQRAERATLTGQTPMEHQLDRRHLLDTNEQKIREAYDKAVAQGLGEFINFVVTPGNDPIARAWANDQFGKEETDRLINDYLRKGEHFTYIFAMDRNEKTRTLFAKLSPNSLFYFDNFMPSTHFGIVVVMHGGCTFASMQKTINPQLIQCGLRPHCISHTLQGARMDYITQWDLEKEIGVTTGALAYQIGQDRLPRAHTLLGRRVFHWQ